MEMLKTYPLCYWLVSQQIGRADSISANIEEGYGRVSRTEYVRFLDFARGSARETRGRYERMKHWLAEDLVKQRIELLDEIIGILTSSIETMKRNGTRVERRVSSENARSQIKELRELMLRFFPSTLDTHPSTLPRPSTPDPRPLVSFER